MLRLHIPQILTALTLAAAGAGFAVRPALAEGIKVSGPFEHDNLAVYFLHGPSAEGPVPLTLDEALEKGRVEVSETGTVSELLIDNRGDEEVLVHAGDIVKGGRQDRVVTTSFILKAKSGPVPLAVFCVEAGRWAARGAEDAKAFASSKEMLPSRRAKLSLRADYVNTDRLRAARAARQAEAAGRPAGLSSGIDVEQNANIEQRQTGHGELNAGPSAQSEIWREVGAIQETLTASLGAKVASEKSETSLQLALENEKLKKAQEAYVDDLASKGEVEDDVVGYVFAVNGKLNSADIYGSNGIFRKVWRKLLKASATEALSAREADGKKPAPGTGEVEAFLARAAEGKEEKLAPAEGITLKARESAAAHDYVTERASGALLHRNILAR